jgi:hypothetical protein
MLPLQAWMVCSIDNDAGAVMPKTTIGLRYPSIEEPNRKLYLEAFRLIHAGLYHESPLNQYVDEIGIQTIRERISDLMDWVEADNN